MQDDNVVFSSSTITKVDSISHVNHSSCSDNINNRIIDDNKDNEVESIGMNHKSIHDQNVNSNDDLGESQAINNNAHDDGDEEFAQLDVFSDFISQVCSRFYVNLLYLCAHISMCIYLFLCVYYISMYACIFIYISFSCMIDVYVLSLCLNR
jgi:hypothetical protein